MREGGAGRVCTVVARWFAWHLPALRRCKDAQCKDTCDACGAIKMLRRGSQNGTRPDYLSGACFLSKSVRSDWSLTTDPYMHTYSIVV